MANVGLSILSLVVIFCQDDDAEPSVHRAQRIVANCNLNFCCSTSKAVVAACSCCWLLLLFSAAAGSNSVKLQSNFLAVGVSLETFPTHRHTDTHPHPHIHQMVESADSWHWTILLVKSKCRMWPPCHEHITHKQRMRAFAPRSSTSLTTFSMAMNQLLGESLPLVPRIL